MAELPRDLYLPAFWFDAHVTLSPPVAKKINLLVNLPDIVVNIGIVVICASLIGVMICVVFRIRNIIARRRQKRFQLVNERSDKNLKYLSSNLFCC